MKEEEAEGDNKEDDPASQAQAMADYSKSVAEAASVVVDGKDEPEEALVQLSGRLVNRPPSSMLL